MTFDLTDIRAALVRAGDSLWARKIRDVSDGEVNEDITAIFDENGWGRWLRGPGGCPEGYTRPPDPDYCGLTYGWIALNAGKWIVPWDTHPEFGIDEALCEHVFPSTYRLNARSKWNKAGYQRPERHKPPQIRPGDIVVLGDSKPYGDHIVMPTAPPSHEGTFVTVEGNAEGRLPGGEHAQGVVKCEHDVEEVTRVWPLQREWFPVQGGTK